MSSSDLAKILDRFDTLENKVDLIDGKSERTWRAIAGDQATHSKGLGERVEENEKVIESFKRDRTKAGALIGAALMILGAFGAKIIEYFKN